MQTNPDRYKWQSTLLFVFMLVGLAMYFSLAIFILFASGFELIAPQSGVSPDIGANFIVACGLGLCGLTMLPAVYFSFKRIRGKTIQPFQARPVRIWQALALATGWIGAVLLSDYLYQNFSLGWLASAPFYGISVGAPLVLLVWIGLGGIPLGSRNRFWGSLGIGMTVGPFLASILELLIYAGILLIMLFIIVLNSNWLASLQQLISKLQGTPNLDRLMPILAPYLTNPFILISIFLMLGVFTPLIEETLKPAIVWLLAKRLQRPSQGFALGIISGAGFALVESMLASSTPGQGWGQLLAARAGGGLMHIFASGLMGWGIASAWQGKRLRLLGTYGLSVLVHGLWNCAAILIEVGALQPYLNNTGISKSLDAFPILGIIILVVLVLMTLPALILINRKMRQPDPTIPVPPEPMI